MALPYVRYPSNMGTRTATSVEQYLHTSFPDLDREYRDGELVERSLPDYPHGRVQTLICVFFEAHRLKHSVYVCSETRMKLREGLYLIPDVAVFRPSPPPRVPATPPLVAIEILSLDDRLSAVRDKLDEYKAWGIPHVWLIDPHSRRFYVYAAGLTEVESLRIPELNVELRAEHVFE